jgi:hypothetical protein
MRDPGCPSGPAVSLWGQHIISCFVYAKGYGTLGSPFRSFTVAFTSIHSWRGIYPVLPEKYALMLFLKCLDSFSSV